MNFRTGKRFSSWKSLGVPIVELRQITTANGDRGEIVST